MKLILLSTPEFFVEEDKILTSLFDKGMELVHLRKFDSEPIYSERLLTLIPEQWHKRIVVHEHFYLVKEFGLRGIHLNPDNPEIPKGHEGTVSCSCHSLEELRRERQTGQDYLFLSPVFNSISKPERHAAYTAAELHDAVRSGLIDRKVMAAGGVNAQTLPQLSDWGFGGAVLLGDLWTRFNIHSGLDYKEVIAHFRKLRKAAG